MSLIHFNLLFINIILHCSRLSNFISRNYSWFNNSDIHYFDLYLSLYSSFLIIIDYYLINETAIINNLHNIAVHSVHHSEFLPPSSILIFINII
jgi:hypothetical protein